MESDPALSSLADIPQLSELCRLLGNDAVANLRDALTRAPAASNTYLRIEGSLCGSPHASISHHETANSRVLLGYINLTGPTNQGAQQQSLPVGDTTSSSNPCQGHPLTPESSSHTDSDEDDARKRRKVVGGLRLHSAVSGNDHARLPNQCTPKISSRQLHNDTRFPQRKPPQEPVIPTLEPTSADKLISGIWRQIFSGIQLTLAKSAFSTINVHGVVDRETFRTINTICLKYSTLSQSARTLEMIVQAYWVECYEARITAIKLERPSKSITEVRMDAVKEACSTLQWKEKELRNKLSIWRGYREIKDAGGWASLAFASSGVYRFCKYRTGFDEAFISRLRQLKSSFEVAADTLHPEWRQLLLVIGQGSPPVYVGHPNEWVITNGEMAMPLAATYPHIPGDFVYQFIEECVLDRDTFGAHDPRLVPDIDPSKCLECSQYQSDHVQTNRCMCFPSLYGNPKSPPPLQIFQTTTGKNNGVITRCALERGTAIGEFIGYITNGVRGVDVMVGGSPQRLYQIYQGQMGNFTRFINHSCRPNCQFQRFHWLGMERIIIVSRGVPADTELTVDYSNHYWEELDKECLCGEACCRYSRSRLTSG
ncbi:hypothetical protein FQN53_000097 [Emmonsiellopsis sp. PD_33]|nr:hypothetical protein FQN53_000097 [Emmonsiellopsis sp. PD_33]